MLLITDEISIVNFKQYQHMNQNMCIGKGTCYDNWGDICVLAAGDLYQVAPVGQSPIYMSPHTAHTLDDFAQMDGKTWNYMNLQKFWGKKMYILHKVSIKSNKQYQRKDQRKIECYKDVN